MNNRHCEQSAKQFNFESREAGLPRRLRLLAMTALVLLSGCILVKDFGVTWTQAKPDACLTKLMGSMYYTEFTRNPDGKDMSTLAHALTRPNGKNYLLIKADANDAGGRMYRFQVVNGIFQRFRIVPTMRDTFERNYPNAPVDLSRDTITFEALGEKEWELIDNIATQDEYWEIEDQSLYNIFRNPQCRFEDRDLSKMD